MKSFLKTWWGRLNMPDLPQVNSCSSVLFWHHVSQPYPPSTSISSPISLAGRRDETEGGSGGLVPRQTALLFKRLFLGPTIWCVALNSPDRTECNYRITVLQLRSWKYLLLYRRLTCFHALMRSQVEGWFGSDVQSFIKPSFWQYRLIGSLLAKEIFRRGVERITHSPRRTSGDDNCKVEAGIVISLQKLGFWWV